MNHSPLPWQFEPEMGDGQVNNFAILDAKSSVVGMTADKEDLCFILHVCNNFDALLKSAKTYRKLAWRLDKKADAAIEAAEEAK